MTDFKKSEADQRPHFPHIRSTGDTRSIILDVIIALLPALAWSVYCFGWKALLTAVSGVVTCVFFRWAYTPSSRRSPAPVGDLGAGVTNPAELLGCPRQSAPGGVIIIGAFFSIVVVKQLTAASAATS